MMMTGNFELSSLTLETSWMMTGGKEKKEEKKEHPVDAIFQ